MITIYGFQNYIPFFENIFEKFFKGIFKVYSRKACIQIGSLIKH